MSQLMALGLPLLASILFALAEVSSLSLSPTDVQSGAASTATVTLDATPSGVGVRVSLTSSNPSVATVPASVTIGAIGTTNFSVKTVQGAAGCTTISAKAKSTTRSAQLFVLPSTSISPVTLTLSKSSVAGGGSLTGRVVVSEPSAIGKVVQLSSSNPSVTVPASVTLSPNEIGVAEATFNIGTVVVAPSTCSVIRATYQSSKPSRKLLKVSTISG